MLQAKVDELGLKRSQYDEYRVDHLTIPVTDLVFRIMTYDHIPDEYGRKLNPKTVADTKVKLNFMHTASSMSTGRFAVPRPSDPARAIVQQTTPAMGRASGITTATPTNTSWVLNVRLRNTHANWSSTQPSIRRSWCGCYRHSDGVSAPWIKRTASCPARAVIFSDASSENINPRATITRG